jgi:hypothetical protein
VNRPGLSGAQGGPDQPTRQTDSGGRRKWRRSGATLHRVRSRIWVTRDIPRAGGSSRRRVQSRRPILANNRDGSGPRRSESTDLADRGVVRCERRAARVPPGRWRPEAAAMGPVRAPARALTTPAEDLLAEAHQASSALTLRHFPFLGSRQRQAVEQMIGSELLQPALLLLDRPETHRRADRHAAVLRRPPIDGRPLNRHFLIPFSPWRGEDSFQDGRSPGSGRPHHCVSLPYARQTIYGARIRSCVYPIAPLESHH